MKIRTDSQLNENKGNLVYKSINPRKRKTIITFIFLATFFFSWAGSMISLSIIIFKEISSPLVIFIGIVFVICSIPVAFGGLIFIFSLIREFITYLYIFERGIEILCPTLIPPKIIRHYIPFENIKKVEIKETYVQINTLYVHVEDREAYELDEFDILDLEEAKNLIIKYIENN